MKIHASPNLTSDGIALDVDPSAGTLVVQDREWGTFAPTLTRDEAAALAEQLVSAVEAIDLAADPYHGKRLTISVRGDVTVSQVVHWRLLTFGDGDSPIYPYASYVLEDMRDQVTNTNIGAILAWGEANPGHPFALTLTDEPDHSDGSIF